MSNIYGFGPPPAAAPAAQPPQNGASFASPQTAQPAPAAPTNQFSFQNAQPGAAPASSIQPAIGAAKAPDGVTQGASGVVTGSPPAAAGGASMSPLAALFAHIASRAPQLFSGVQNQPQQQQPTNGSAIYG